VIAIVAAVAGLLGVILGGILQSEAGRVALLREQQLRVASELSGTCLAVFTVLDREMRGLGSPVAFGRGSAEWLEQLDVGIAVAREELRSLMTHLGGVEIMFGSGSIVQRTAMDLATHLHSMFAEAEKRPGDTSVVSREYELAAEDLSAFHAAAHEVFARSIWRRT
jgi:hypothetical protein